jgi:DNA modification methylase
MELNKIYNMDCLECMKLMPDKFNIASKRIEEHYENIHMSSIQWFRRKQNTR